MGKISITKSGKSKSVLLEELQKLKVEFSSHIAENDVKLDAIPDGFRIKAEKKVLFLTFYVDANIIAKDGAYEITWESNAPSEKVDEALAKVKEVLSRN